MLIVVVSSCSSNDSQSVLRLHDNETITTQKVVIVEEDYPIILTECLNEKEYNIQTPFDIEDLKSRIGEIMNNKNNSKGDREQIMEDINICIKENELWPDKESINPEEQAELFDNNLGLAQCLRNEGLDVPDPTQDKPKIDLSSINKEREDLKKYLDKCVEERWDFEGGKK